MSEDLKKFYQSKIESLRMEFQKTKDLETKLREERDQLNLRLAGIRDQLLQFSGAWSQLNELISGLDKEEEKEIPGEEKERKLN